MSSVTDALRSPNVQAFLHAIRLGEGTADELGYNRIVGGELFQSFADHPRKLVQVGGVASTAAGAYQFLSRTWDEMASKYGLNDFSPHNQDIAAVGLIIRRKALDDVIAGRIPEAIEKCSLEWASLPGSPHGQRTESLAAVLAEYAKYGGELAPIPAEAATELAEGYAPSIAAAAAAAANAPAPAPEPAPAPVAAVDTPPAAPITESTPTWEAPMAPLIPALFQAAAAVIPDLIRLNSNSQRGEVNAKTAETVLGAITQATGAVNAQQAVERIQTDPAARHAATEAVRAQWFDIMATDEKSVVAAREFNRTWRDGQPFIQTKHVSLTFVEFLSLVLVSISALGAFYVLSAPSEAFSPDIKASVVTLMLIGGFTGVLTFWLGSSRDSQRKTELIGGGGRT